MHAWLVGAPAQELWHCAAHARSSAMQVAQAGETPVAVAMQSGTAPASWATQSTSAGQVRVPGRSAMSWLPRHAYGLVVVVVVEVVLVLVEAEVDVAPEVELVVLAPVLLDADVVVAPPGPLELL